MYHSIDISGANTWDRWHLVPSSRPVVAPPEVRTKYVDLPGTHGYIDLTELLIGGPAYGKRSGSWSFAAHPSYSDREPWNTKYQDIMQYLHGKQHKIILEDDPFFYYEGRLTVSSWSSGKSYSTVNIGYNLKPFKKEIISSEEDWLWDPFCFENGIIRGYSNIAINGTKYFRIDTGEEKVKPTVSNTGSGTLTLIYRPNADRNATWAFETIEPGESKSYVDFVLQGEKNYIYLTGTTTVTISFRGGWL